ADHPVVSDAQQVPDDGEIVHFAFVEGFDGDLAGGAAGKAAAAAEVDLSQPGGGGVEACEDVMAVGGQPVQAAEHGSEVGVQDLLAEADGVVDALQPAVGVRIEIQVDAAVAGDLEQGFEIG